MNVVVLIGRLVRDPELRYSSGDAPTAICTFTMAVDRQKREDDTADFIRCIAFGRQGENISKYMTKGRQIGVKGRIQTGSYEKDGQMHYTTDVIVDRFDFIGNKSDAQEAPAKEPKQMKLPEDQIPDGYAVIDEEDVPF